MSNERLAITITAVFTIVFGGTLYGLMAFGQTRPADDPRRLVRITLTRADGTTETLSNANFQPQPTSQPAVETFDGSYHFVAATQPILADVATTQPAIAAADLPFLAKGATIDLKPGRTYALRVTTTLHENTIRGNGATIQYLGGKDYSSAWQGGGTIQDVQFVIGPKRYAWAGAGTIRLTRCAVGGGGGLLKGDGAVAIIEKCVQRDMTDEYFVYSARSSVSLTDCILTKGSKYQSLVRGHSFPVYDVERCLIDDSAGPKAAVRLHDGGQAVMRDNVIVKDANFGPMGEADGGINLPPGPARDAADALRLQSLMVERCTFDTHAFKINAGIVAGAFADCTIRNSAGGSVIDNPWPYMRRPQSTVSFNRCAFVHKDGTGKLSSSYKFPTTQSTLNGKPLSD